LGKRKADWLTKRRLDNPGRVRSPEEWMNGLISPQQRRGRLYEPLCQLEQLVAQRVSFANAEPLAAGQKEEPKFPISQVLFVVSEPGGLDVAGAFSASQSQESQHFRWVGAGQPFFFRLDLLHSLTVSALSLSINGNRLAKGQRADDGALWLMEILGLDAKPLADLEDRQIGLLRHRG
jgi:hypothetical protein